jgi:hypothetical protein
MHVYHMHNIKGKVRSWSRSLVSYKLWYLRLDQCTTKAANHRLVANSICNKKYINISLNHIIIIHTNKYILITIYPRRVSRGVSDIAPRPTFYQNYLTVRNTADVTGSNPIVVWSQSISGVNAINPIVTLYDVNGRKREVLFFYLSRTPHETYHNHNIV